MKKQEDKPQGSPKRSGQADKDVARQDETTGNANAEISGQDLQDLENSGNDLSSDESRSADMLDNEDDEGAALNEGPDEEDLFDTGADLDISEEALFPDIDPDSDDH